MDTEYRVLETGNFVIDVEYCMLPLDTKYAFDIYLCLGEGVGVFACSFF